MGSRIAPGRSSTAFATVDLDQPGKQLGFVMIPHSPHDDAWGVTRLPLAVIANGSGPTVILEGGNHGDEYEGPIVITELIRELDASEIQGRLIMMPAINAPAVIAAVVAARYPSPAPVFAALPREAAQQAAGWRWPVPDDWAAVAPACQSRSDGRQRTSRLNAAAALARPASAPRPNVNWFTFHP